MQVGRAASPDAEDKERRMNRGVSDLLTIPQVFPCGQPVSMVSANAVARVCALGPGGLDDYGPAIALAERAAQRHDADDESDED